MRFAAFVCTAATAFGAGATARADDGVPVAPDPATVADTAVTIAGQAADTALPGQYQPDTGQYQAPQGNINVSVRVLSPGDDDAVNQAVSVAQPAPAPAAPAAPVSISINVNVTTNWTVVFPKQNDTGQYHSPGNQYTDPGTISATISAAQALPAADPVPAPPPAVAAPAPAPAPAAALPDDRWGAKLQPVAAPTTHITRGTHHRPAAAPTPVRRVVPAPPAAVESPPPPAAWAAARSITRAPAPHDGGGARPRPAGPPVPPVPPRPTTPEQYSGAAAAGGTSLGNVLQTLGLLLALLCVGGVGSALRLTDHVQRLRSIAGPRPAKPG